MKKKTVFRDLIITGGCFITLEALLRIIKKMKVAKGLADFFGTPPPVTKFKQGTRKEGVPGCLHRGRAENN